MSCDLTAIAESDLTLVDAVVSTIVEKSSVDPGTMMIVGAQCRDLLHIAYGYTTRLRRTQDVDLSILVSDRGQYQKITDEFRPTGDTGVRFRIAEIPVDIIPFGEIEDPAGSAPVPNRSDVVDVFAFREVFGRASTLTTPRGHSTKLPTPQGYAALKLKAWCDRSARHEYKDAGDLAIVCDWYRNDSAVGDHLYDNPLGNDLLLATGMDVGRAALILLGRDIAAEIGAVRTNELRDAWRGTDVGLFVAHFARSMNAGAAADVAAGRQDVDALTSFLADERH